jgi:Amt family ammonium transporter
MAYVVLGTFILWIGWLMFNAGSSLALYADSARAQAARSMMNTFISPASAGLTAFFFKKYITGEGKLVRHDLQALTNGILAGLVGITASCAMVRPYAAFIIGILSALVYSLACRLLNKLKIDDPLEAFQIHGACGAFGVLITAFFHEEKGIFYGGEDAGEFLGYQIVGIIVITLWSGVLSFIFFFIASKMKRLRVSKSDEILGLDFVEHLAIEELKMSDIKKAIEGK